MAKTDNSARCYAGAGACGHLQLGIARMTAALAPTLGPAGTPVVVEGNARNKIDLIDDAATVARRILSLGDPLLDIGATIVVMSLAGFAACRRRRRHRGRPPERDPAGRPAPDHRRRQCHATGARHSPGDGGRHHYPARPGPALRRRDAAGRRRPHGHPRRRPVGHARRDELIGQAPMRPYRSRPTSPPISSASTSPAPSTRPGSPPPIFTLRASASAWGLAAPAVALVDYNISTAEQAVGLLNAALQAGRTAASGSTRPHISGAALQLLVANHAQPPDKRKIAVPGRHHHPAGRGAHLGSARPGAACRCHHFARLRAKPSSAPMPADLGTALRVEFTAEKLAVVAEVQHRAEVQEVIADLRSHLDRLTLDDEGRPAVERRLAALTGGLGVLKVGDVSKLATEMRKNQAERTFKVLSAVQRSGLVAGAGAAYVHCQAAIRQAAAERDLDEDAVLGMRVGADALAAPMRRLLENAGVEPPSVVIQRVIPAGGPQATYGWEQQKVVDAHAAGVVDAADVLVTVLQSATSGAIMALDRCHRLPQEATTEPGAVAPGTCHGGDCMTANSTPNPGARPPRLSCRRLAVIFHVDDVGMCHGSNRAYLELHEAGIVKTGSLMAPVPVRLRDDHHLPAAARPGFGRPPHPQQRVGELPLGPAQDARRDRESGLIDETGSFWPLTDIVAANLNVPAAVAKRAPRSPWSTMRASSLRTSTPTCSRRCCPTSCPITSSWALSTASRCWRCAVLTRGAAPSISPGWTTRPRPAWPASLEERGMPLVDAVRVTPGYGMGDAEGGRAELYERILHDLPPGITELRDPCQRARRHRDDSPAQALIGVCLNTSTSSPTACAASSSMRKSCPSATKNFAN